MPVAFSQNTIPTYSRELTVPASSSFILHRLMIHTPKKKKKEYRTIIKKGSRYVTKTKQENYINYRPPPTIVRIYPGGPLPIGPYGPGVIEEGIPACIGPPKAKLKLCCACCC